MTSTEKEPASRTLAFAWVIGAYVVAIGVAFGVGWALGSQHPLVVAGGADLAGTLVIFVFAVIFDNSSFYDAYWSVAPVPILGYFIAVGGHGESVRAVILLVLVSIWSLRLTYNWARGWSGLGHEDWRYRDIRGWSGRYYWPASLLTIMLLPTVLVFGGCLPAWAALTVGGAVRPFGGLDMAAAAVTTLAIFIEVRADKQLLAFVRGRPRPEAIMDRGLWAYSRHPNYFGEVLFWWGLYLFALAAAPERWWVVLGPAAITALFLFISIPLIDKRMAARRPGYAAHCERVSRFVPWFGRRQG